MELYQLEYFLEAARQRSFTRAAERLGLAQAALSEQMRKLEAELGAPLFHRGRRETTLAAAGETLLPHAEGLLAQAARARQAVADLVALRGGRLVVGVLPSVSASVLPEAITHFRRDCPRVELALIEGTSLEIARFVESGRVDLGIVQLPAGGDGFHETPLFTEPFALLAPALRRLGRQGKVRLADLTEEGFVFFKGRARDLVHMACLAAGFEPRIVCESGELDTIRALVGAGLGIALLPQFAISKPPKPCVVLQLEGEALTRRVALIQRAGRTLSPAAEAFRKLLIASTAKLSVP